MKKLESKSGKCLVLLMVALVSVAIIGNVILAEKERTQYASLKPTEQALIAPPMWRKTPITQKRGAAAAAATTKRKPTPQEQQGTRESKVSSTWKQMNGTKTKDGRRKKKKKVKQGESPAATKKRQELPPQLHQQGARTSKEPSKGLVKSPAEVKPRTQQEATRASIRSPTSSEQINGTRSKDDHSDDKHSTVHVVFSTSCHVKQDWQSYLFFFQAMIQGQQGTVTRIVSGCRPEEQEKLAKHFAEKIAIMSDGFRIHFTPEFGRVPGKDYEKTKYWNKPFGLKHWFENALGFNISEGGNLTTTTPHDDDIVVLVDPDMIMQRPFVNHFPEIIPNMWTNTVYQNGGPLERVTHGKPMAQLYGFEANWLKTVRHNLTYVVGPDSPVHKVNIKDAKALYPAGPPYVVTARDMYQISYWWALFLPRIFFLVDEFMAEMYGYSMAAAHLKMPHQLANGFMVSHAKAWREGWKFMDQNVTTTACNVSQFGDRVPQVIHYCQQYSIGEFFLNKRKLPAKILSCDFPLLQLPPLDIASYTNYSRYLGAPTIVWPESQQRLLYQNAYMVCTLMPAINQAARYFKDHHCPNGANYNETWNTFAVDKKVLRKSLKEEQ